jgi:hypothetical protein
MGSKGVKKTLKKTVKGEGVKKIERKVRKERGE